MAPEIMKGLKDVYLDTTESSFIDGQEGKLLYRGYNIHDLAEKSTFEEVIYLLLYSKLPTQQELADFDATLRANRRIPDNVIQILELLPKNSHPMDALRTGISALSGFDPDVNDNSVEATIRKGIRLTAMGPTIVAGAITFGLFRQITNAFEQVESSFQYLVHSWSTIVELISIYKRLQLFESHINISTAAEVPA